MVLMNLAEKQLVDIEGEDKGRVYSESSTDQGGRKDKHFLLFFLHITIMYPA